MSNPAMVLARQGPQQSNPTNVGRSTSPDRAGPDDAAAECAGIEALPWAAARLVWSIDARDMAVLERHLYLAAIDLSIVEGWPRALKGSERIRKLVHVALLEAANPRGIWIDDVNGKVRRRWNGALRASLIGMEAPAYRVTWAKCYEGIYKHLNGWVQVAARRIAHNSTTEKF